MASVVFLRAINVGGSKIIKMDHLRQKFETLDLLNVQTFIQSGNVIFEIKGKGSAALENKIETQLEKALGYKVEIFLRSMAEPRTPECRKGGGR